MGENESPATASTNDIANTIDDDVVDVDDDVDDADRAGALIDGGVVNAGADGGRVATNTTTKTKLFEPEPDPDPDPSFDALLEFLHRNRGFDFTGYKRASLVRRVRRRMQAVGIQDFGAYLDHLEVHPDEFPQLFNLLLINVTAFFRDPHSWQALRGRLASVVGDGGANDGSDAVRVWSAGCSSGEEPYSIAILLAEMLGLDGYLKRVKIYATDVDDEALAVARQGAYSRKALESVDPMLVEKYFTALGSKLVVNKDLRRMVIFGRHDLAHDAPIPRVHLLACRNALMYFNAEAQTKILQRLQFALNPGGLLFLGRAEMLLTHTDLFSPLDLKRRIFTRAPKTTAGGNRDTSRGQLSGGGGGSDGARLSKPDDERQALHAAAFNTSAAAQIVVDVAGRLALHNSDASQLFSLTPADVGRPFQDLEVSYRPAELRSLLDRVRSERRPLFLKEVERPSRLTGEPRYYDIDLTPLISSQGGLLGTQISFHDVTTAHRLQHDLQRANTDLASAHEELQSTSEELETTNEELQSTVEELETTNEELQSTNEELETMNEELQSTNVELQTINEELRQRGSDVNDTNAFFGAVLGSMHAGVAVLDDAFQIKLWSSKMEDLWGIRANEVHDKHFLGIDIGLPIERLAASLRTCVATGTTSEIVIDDCTNRRGKTVRCRIRVSPFEGHPTGFMTTTTKGVLVVVEEV